MKGYEHLKWSNNSDDVDRYLRIKEGEQREMQQTAKLIGVLALFALAANLVLWLVGVNI